MITGDHDLHQTRWDIPDPRECTHFKLWPFYKAFSTLNARSPLFAGTTRNLSLAPSKMLRALVPIYPSRRGDRINCQLLQCVSPVMALFRPSSMSELSP